MKIRKRNKILAALKRNTDFRFGRRRRPDKLYLSLCVLISTAVVVYIGCRCLLSVFRSMSAVWDVVTSVCYYVYNFYAVISETDNPVGATVVGIPLTNDNVLFPQTYEAFVAKLKGFWGTFFSAENFRGFVANIPQVIYNLSIILMFALPIVLMLVIMFKLSWDEQNNDTDITTKPLKRWHWFCRGNRPCGTAHKRVLAVRKTALVCCRVACAGDAWLKRVYIRSGSVCIFAVLRNVV